MSQSRSYAASAPRAAAFALIVPLLADYHPARAEQVADATLPDTVVTATRLPTPASRGRQQRHRDHP